MKYNVEFNCLAIQTGWDDSILRHHYYSGLAEQIKDVMGQQGKLATLKAMKVLMHSINSRHYERLCKKSRSEKGKSNKEKSDKDKSNEKTGNPNSSNNSSNSNNNKKNKSHQNCNSGKPTSSRNSAALSDKLGKDGKLTPQERQHRFDNNLCMFCGRTGHTAKDCPKSSSSASKARAVQAKEKDKESLDSKKT